MRGSEIISSRTQGPDFAQTGARLASVIDRLFEGTLRIAVAPLFGKLAEDDEHFRCCLKTEVRRW